MGDAHILINAAGGTFPEQPDEEMIDGFVLKFHAAGIPVDAGGVTVRPGGFIDIAQNVRKVVFCGTFDVKGAEIDAENGRLVIRRHGDVR